MGFFRICAMVVAAVSALIVEPARAAQTLFRVQEQGDQMAFQFGWTDVAEQEQGLVFRLPIRDLNRGKEEFSTFDNNEANSYAFDKVKKKAEEMSVGRVKIEIVPAYNGYTIEAKGLSEAEVDARVAELQKVREQALDDYLALHFYTRMQGNSIMPDHRKIARRYAPALSPLATAIRSKTQGYNIRDTADWLLGFLQNIPYDTLTSRFSSNGAGFQTPYGLFYGNKGDCDTKSVAMAALLRGLYPSLSLAMVYVPNHAFIGIGIPQGPKDYALRLGNRVYVLADPTGPKLLKLGEVDTKALEELNQGMFSYQVIPF